MLRLFGYVIGWGLLGMFYGASVMAAYAVGNVRGARRATRTLRRRLMMAGSQFAGGE
jgi:hypothetical protein